MRILALDIGVRRTGVAYAECPPGVPLALPTLRHASVRALLEHVAQIVDARRVDHIVVGLPILSSGKEGMQAQRVRALLPSLARMGARVTTLDERHSTAHFSHDPDAEAACTILMVYLDRLDAGHS